jgi:RNA recognition motif-containing protein
MSGNKIFLGNLPWSTTTDSLGAMLRDTGYVFHSAKVIADKETGRSRGFAFVEFETPEAAVEAIQTLDGYVLDGRSLHASEANERPRRGPGESNRGNGGAGRQVFDSSEHDGSEHRRKGKGRRERNESRKW